MKLNAFFFTLIIVLYLSGCSQTVVRPGAEFISKPEKIGESYNEGVIVYPEKEVNTAVGIQTLSTKEKVESRKIAVQLAAESCNGKHELKREAQVVEDVCVTEECNTMGFNCVCVTFKQITTNEIYFKCEEGVIPKDVASVPYIRDEDTFVGDAFKTSVRTLKSIAD